MMRLFAKRDAQKSRKSGENGSVGRRVSCPLTSPPRPLAPSPPAPPPPKGGEGSHTYVACSKSRRYRSARLGEIGNHKNRNVIRNLGTSARRVISPIGRP